MVSVSSRKQRISSLAATAGVLSAVSLVACGQSRGATVADTTSGNDSTELSTDVTERDCPKTIALDWSVNEVKPIAVLRNNAEYQKAVQGLDALKNTQRKLEFTRSSISDKQCVYNENNNALAAKIFIKKVEEENFGEYGPRFLVLTRMSVRIQESSTGTRFLSFFTIGATDSGETFIDGDDDDIKQLLTPVADKLRSIGTIKYAFEFAPVQ
jgi:hypothetical protein